MLGESGMVKGGTCEREVVSLLSHNKLLRTKKKEVKDAIIQARAKSSLGLLATE